MIRAEWTLPELEAAYSSKTGAARRDAACHLAWSLRSTETARSLELAESSLAEFETDEPESGSSSDSARAWARLAVAHAHQLTGDRIAAEPLARSALEAFERCDDVRGRGLALLGLALCAQAAGEPDGAGVLGGEALRCCKLAGDRSGESSVFNLLGSVATGRGDAERADACFRGALDAARACGDTLNLMNALGHLGAVHYHAGRWSEACAVWGEVAEYGRATGRVRLVSTSLRNQADVFLQLDSPGRARERALEALALSREERDEQGIADALQILADSENRLGDPAAAERAVAEALEIDRRIGDRMGEASGLRVLAEIVWNVSAPRDGLDQLARCIAVFAAIGAPVAKAEARVELGRRLALLGRDDEALAEFERADEVARRAGARGLSASALLGIAGCQLRAGRPDTALVRLESALMLTVELELPHPGPEIHRELCELHRAAGRSDVALRHLRAALEFDREIAALRAEEERRRSSALLEVDRLAIAAAAERARNRALSEANAYLEQIHREQSELIRLVVRDLHAPLTEIDAAAALLSAEHEPDDGNGELPDRARLGELIRRTTGRLESLVAQLADVASADAAPEGDEPGVADLGALAAEVAERHRATAAAARVDLRVELLRGEVLARAAPGAVRKVLENLVTNALKFSPDGGSVRVLVERTNTHAVVDVRDEGPGITAEDQPRLFSKFGRLTARPARGEPSTGLGLYIVRRLVRAMDGRILVRSAAGRGARFRVELPANVATISTR